MVPFQNENKIKHISHNYATDIAQIAYMFPNMQTLFTCGRWRFCMYRPNHDEIL